MNKEILDIANYIEKETKENFLDIEKITNIIKDFISNEKIRKNKEENIFEKLHQLLCYYINRKNNKNCKLYRIEIKNETFKIIEWIARKTCDSVTITESCDTIIECPTSWFYYCGVSTTKPHGFNIPGYFIIDGKLLLNILKIFSDFKGEYLNCKIIIHIDKIIFSINNLEIAINDSYYEEYNK